MANNKDMSRDAKTQAESFYLSNIVPQDPANNQRFWKAVEDRFRNYVNTYGSLFIITGAVFNKPLPPGGVLSKTAIGKDQVRVPTWLFKIAVRELPNHHYEALAIETPNVPIYDKATGADNVLTSMLTSIDTIEADTGMNFLNALSEAEQKRVESKPAPRLWPVGGRSTSN